MASIQHIKNILLARGYQEELFSGLSGNRKREKGGRETLCNCPFCEDKGGHFSYSSAEPLWKCWKCGKSGDWIDYLRESRGLPFKQAALELAGKAGVELDGSAADKAKYEAYTRKASVLDAAQQLFIQKLLESEETKEIKFLQEEKGISVKDIEARGYDIVRFYKEKGWKVEDIRYAQIEAYDEYRYLRIRGYSIDDIKAMELGAYLGQTEALNNLQQQGYSEKELKDSGLFTHGFGGTHRLSMLWRDSAGRAIGLACRCILPDEHLKAKNLQKYKYSFGLKKDNSLVGFSTVRGSEQLVLVEGVLDALLLNARGFKAVATGGTSLSAGQLQAMEATGTKELLLCPDTDPVGKEAAARIIESLSSSKLRLYVVDTKQYKDADELVRAEGNEAFQECLNQAERASRWYARMLVHQQDIRTDRGLDRAVFNVLEYSAGLQDGIERKAVEDCLKLATGLTDEDLAIKKQQHERTASTVKAEATLKATLRQLQEKVNEQDISGAEVLLQAGLQGLRQSRGVEAPEPYLLASLIEDLSSTTPGLETGYPCLDKQAKVQQGALTIIAGRPGHCKTAFMANCLLNQVEKYPEKAFCLFSYEESRARLSIRLLTILAGDVIHAESNKGDYIHYLKAGRNYQQRPQIDEAMKKYEQYTSSGRLLLADRMPPAEDLASIIRHICQRQEVGGIFIDYIQKVPLRTSQGQRYLDIKQVSQLLLEQAVLNNVPIVLGAQLSRPEKRASVKWQEIVSLDGLRESGDIEQDANLVLGLWNTVAGQKKQDDAAIHTYTRVAELKVACLKNRDGQPDWTRTMYFDGATQRITEAMPQIQQAAW